MSTDYNAPVGNIEAGYIALIERMAAENAALRQAIADREKIIECQRVALAYADESIRALKEAAR